MFKKVGKWIAGLPKEAKLLLAFVGLTTPPGIFYLLRRALGPSVPLWKVILYVGGLVLALIIVVLIIGWLFAFSKRSRARRMASEMADDRKGGLQSLDITARKKANNEKFFNAIRDMKGNIGVDVYDLPWYIVIGDSGCGKTKLINEGGLTFSTGKPEGYKLGTLDYNWWFTEDAIFIDMAGRLCNPQDDADRREWMAFLETIAKGRKGFPINGALVCVSTEHLLKDPPEKVEEYANITLERLRDLQMKLGVTFATYLVITKCDKIMGFMQFFDRAAQDITIKNQIFGWSRPGDFNELYNPENFKSDFDGLYHRLHELRLRRLNDDEKIIDLGFAYSFPEEFRQLREPLSIYINTLFPYIRNPRAVKNLIFRGVYYTSATQEGELITKHFAERMGAEAAGRFAPLDDLYPHKRPHFIKELLFRKVFPERGLVFRNEQQVVRNHKLDRALKIGTGVLAVFLIAAFLYASSAMQRELIDPSDELRVVADDLEKRPFEPTEALEKSAKLREYAENTRKHWIERVALSVGFGSQKPVVGFERAAAALIEIALVDELKKADEALRWGLALSESEPTQQDVETYQKALEAYLTWYSCTPPQEGHSLDWSGFEALTALSHRRLQGDLRDTRMREAKWYFDHVNKAGHHLERNPAVLLARADLALLKTIETAVGELRGYFGKYYATWSERHKDPTVRRWAEMTYACETIKSRYGNLLGLVEKLRNISTVEAYTQAQKGFKDDLGAIKIAAGKLNWEFGRPLPPLGSVLLDVRNQWVELGRNLDEAAQRCSANDGLSRIVAGVVEGDDGLDLVFWQSLKANGIINPNLRTTQPAFGDDNFRTDFQTKYITQVPDIYPWLVRFKFRENERNPELSTGIEAHDDVKVIVDVLSDIASSLQPLGDGTYSKDWKLEEMNTALDQHLAGVDKAIEDEFRENQSESLVFSGDYNEQWKPDGLKNLKAATDGLSLRARGTDLVKRIHERLSEIKGEPMAFLELFPEQRVYREHGSAYQFDFSRLNKRDRHPVEPQQMTDDDSSKGRRGRRSSRRRGDRDAGERPARPISDRPQALPACRKAGYQTRDFLQDGIEETFDLLLNLSDMANMQGAYLAPEYERKGGEQGDGRLEDSMDMLRGLVLDYVRRYSSDWKQAYWHPCLSSFENFLDNVNSWEELTKKAGQSHPAQLTGDFETSFSELLIGVWMLNVSAEEGTAWSGLLDDEDTIDLRDRWLDIGREAMKIQTENWSNITTQLVEPSEVRGQPPQVVSEFITAKFTSAYSDLLNRIKDKQPVSFTRIKELREQYNLKDEKLTQTLQEAEAHFAALLDEWLTHELRDLCRTKLGADCNRNGVVRLGGHEGEEVADFLIAFREKRDEIKDLEESLKDASVSGKPARAVFYEGCEAWRTFLGIDEQKGLPTITVRRLDPGDKGCNRYADFIVLELGFREIKEAVAGRLQNGVAISCLVEESGNVRKQLEWSVQPGTGPALARLEGGTCNGAKSELGKQRTFHGFLDLLKERCREQNKQQKKVWDLPLTFNCENGVQVLETLQFEINRPLPEPIPAIE